MTKGRIIIAGALAQKPSQGGHAWVLLQYLLGLKRLGWDVLFVDELDSNICRDASGQPCSIEDSVNLRSFQDVMYRFGFERSYALIVDRGREVIGLSRRNLNEYAADCDLLINIMGFLQDDEVLSRVDMRVFVDIDPGFAQMWHDLNLHDSFSGHDQYVTIGENIGWTDCTIPSCGLTWITTPQPVVLDYWPPSLPCGNQFTTIASWRGAYGPVEYKGQTYGLRVHEFRKFANLPRLSRRPFQLALDIHPADAKDFDLLRENGWSLVDPKAVAGDTTTYQAYIRDSKAEFLIAKNMYVQTRSGWFSDRSICYLASGKPVLAQDTGFARLYPTGEGLLTFSTVDEALAGIDEISRNYLRHSRAARALAEEYFDSDRVLKQLFAKLGID